jgi:hypothetical protein
MNTYPTVMEIQNPGVCSTDGGDVLRQIIDHTSTEAIVLRRHEATSKKMIE